MARMPGPVRYLFSRFLAPLRVSLFRASLFLCSLGLLAAAPSRAAEPGQPDAVFATAMRDRSTSPYLIRVTVVDERTGEATTGCYAAPFLLGAIQLERWGRIASDTHEAQAIRIALNNQTRVFHFASGAALANLLPPVPEAEACEAVRQGRLARIADRTGQIVYGPFEESPHRLGCAPAGDPRGPAPSWEELWVALLIGPDGTVQDSRIDHSTGSADLDEALRRAYAGCRFTPWTVDGVPEPAPRWMTLGMGSRVPWEFPPALPISGVLHELAASIAWLGQPHPPEVLAKIRAAHPYLLISLSALSAQGGHIAAVLESLRSAGSVDPSLWEDLEDSVEDLILCLRGPLEGSSYPRVNLENLVRFEFVPGGVVPRLKIDTAPSGPGQPHKLDRAAVDAYIQGLRELADQADSVRKRLATAP
jgi:TonB family protein